MQAQVFAFSRTTSFTQRFAGRPSTSIGSRTVSFDLMSPGSIVEKANTWLGRGTALQDSQERFKIHFLLGEPKQPGTRKAFEHAQHLLKKIPGHPQMVRENQLVEFAEEVAAGIFEHDESEAVVREEPPRQ
jgi:hypothetical protein